MPNRYSRNMLSRVGRVNKAALTTELDGSGAYEGVLTTYQAEAFLKIAITPQSMLPDVRTVLSNAEKWQESTIDLERRVLHATNEAARLRYADRAAPDTGMVEISTELFRAELPVSDEIMEGNVANDRFGDELITSLAEAVGRDIEDIMLSSSVVSTDTHIRGDAAPSDFSSFNGWLKLAMAGVRGSSTTTDVANRTDGRLVDATSFSVNYQELFKKMVQLMPSRFKRDKANMRFYCPSPVVESLRDEWSRRGTVAGDMYLEGDREPRYQSIPIMDVSLMPIVEEVGANDHSYILLTHKTNLYAGYRRFIRMETWRDPREGATSFIAHTRFAPAIAVPAATVIAQNVVVET